MQDHNEPNPTAYTWVAANLSLPDYVKSASASPADYDELSPAAFADAHARKFPVHSKPDVWKSAACALVQGGASAHVMVRIKQAAKLHGIATDIEALEAELASKTAKAVAPKAFALTLEKEGKTFRVLPCSTEAETYASLRELDATLASGEKRARFSPQLFRTAAIALVKAAHTTGLSEDLVPARVRALGEERLPDFEKAATLIKLRSGHEACREHMGLYEALVKGAAEDPAQLQEAVTALTELDVVCKVAYSATQPDPYSIFFRGPSVSELEKLASRTILISDIPIPATAFSMIPADKVRARFEPTTADLILGCAKYASAADLEVIGTISSALDTALDTTGKHQLLDILAST
jgi:hypothetical protein